ncbi:odorant receptor 67c-like [Halyomorpha halys]|uniref:odorant receptor 67c-like n=1 Tax=Halyomorpha halys TaxID=286706 RepID=UPI0006D526AF|nr:Odorant receptor 27 [Halyomorpha halys]
MDTIKLSAEDIPIDRQITHDYETDRKNLMYMSGFKVNNDSNLKYILSKIYVYAIIFFYSFLVSMGSVAAILIHDKKLKLEAVHWTFLNLVGLIFMVIRYTYVLDEPLKTIRTGFFTYENEFIDDRYLERKRYHVRRIRIVSNMFLGLAISNGILLSFIKQVKKSSEVGNYGKSINIGLPIPIFLPFDTTTTNGFVLGYLINVVAFFYLVVITSSAQQIFLSFMEQGIVQFEILNISISNIEKRAYYIYSKGKACAEGISIELYRTRKFQNCISQCLRQNVRHHQTLLRFRNDIKTYVEAVFVLLILASIVVFAAIMFVILELQDLSEASTLFWLLSTEIIYVFVVCIYGELFSQESAKMFYALWDIPWWNFDKRNKVILHIMLSNSMNPVVINAPFFSSNMSLESFGDIMARAYQFMSVVRNVDRK